MIGLFLENQIIGDKIKEIIEELIRRITGKPKDFKCWQRQYLKARDQETKNECITGMIETGRSFLEYRYILELRLTEEQRRDCIERITQYQLSNSALWDYVKQGNFTATEEKMLRETVCENALLERDYIFILKTSGFTKKQKRYCIDKLIDLAIFNTDCKEILKWPEITKKQRKKCIDRMISISGIGFEYFEILNTAGLTNLQKNKCLKKVKEDIQRVRADLISGLPAYVREIKDPELRKKALKFVAARMQQVSTHWAELLAKEKATLDQ